MESRKLLCSKFSMVVALLGLLFASPAAQAVAGDTATGLVPVVLKAEPDGIEPFSVKVQQGNTIAWLNMGPGPATIKFITRLGLACAAPTNFYGDLLGYYETSAIPPGGTASICLIEAGEYEYEVRRLTEKKGEKPLEFILKGKITCIKK